MIHYVVSGGWCHIKRFRLRRQSKLMQSISSRIIEENSCLQHTYTRHSVSTFRFSSTHATPLCGCATTARKLFLINTTKMHWTKLCQSHETETEIRPESGSMGLFLRLDLSIIDGNFLSFRIICSMLQRSALAAMWWMAHLDVYNSFAITRVCRSYGSTTKSRQKVNIYAHMRDKRHDAVRPKRVAKELVRMRSCVSMSVIVVFNIISTFNCRIPLRRIWRQINFVVVCVCVPDQRPPTVIRTFMKIHQMADGLRFMRTFRFPTWQ